MAQEFWDMYNQLKREMKQLENEVIDFLERNGIEFKVDGDVVMIKGDVGFAEFSGDDDWQEIITIVQGDKKITWEFHKPKGMLEIGGLKTPGYDKYIVLPGDMPVRYNKPYLLLIFRANPFKRLSGSIRVE